MPVVIKCCFVVEVKTALLLNAISPPPPGTPWGVADADKPLEKNEAVIRSCPTGTNVASVTGGMILTVCPAASAEFPIRPLHYGWMIAVRLCSYSGVHIIRVSSSFPNMWLRCMRLLLFYIRLFPLHLIRCMFDRFLRGISCFSNKSQGKENSLLWGEMPTKEKHSSRKFELP